MPMVRANGIDLYYEVSGGGPAILGIHGTPSSAVLWEAAAQKLAGLGRCIIYDRRGFGRSERPVPFNATDLSEHVDDAVAIIDKLAATPATIIGRSTGGLIALGLAHHYPETVRALVLLEPAFFEIDPEAAAWANALRRKILEAAEDDPESASEFVIREALGVETWNSLPDDFRALFVAASPAVLAEMRGQGLDLSEHPLQLRSDQIASIPADSPHLSEGFP